MCNQQCLNTNLVHSASFAVSAAVKARPDWLTDNWCSETRMMNTDSDSNFYCNTAHAGPKSGQSNAWGHQSVAIAEGSGYSHFCLLTYSTISGFNMRWLIMLMLISNMCTFQSRFVLYICLHYGQFERPNGPQIGPEEAATVCISVVYFIGHESVIESCTSNKKRRCILKLLKCWYRASLLGATGA